MKRFIALSLVFAAVFSLSAAEMYYNRLSTGNVVVPAGTYGDIVVPEGGYYATKFPSALGTISESEGDFGGSYSNVIQASGSYASVFDHTISGWFKIPVSAADITLFIVKSDEDTKSHRGYKVMIPSDGTVKVGKVNGSDGWQNWSDHATWIWSQELGETGGKVPINQWFYLTLAVTKVSTSRAMTVKMYVNGVEINMPTGTVQTDLRGTKSCNLFKVGDNVECAGLRIDDTAVSDVATIKSWATKRRYVRTVLDSDYAMPYVSMGYEITNDTSGVFLTYNPQLAFPGYTLEDALQHDFFGRLAGANYSGSGSSYEGGLRPDYYKESWTNEQGKLEKMLFAVNGHWRGTSGYYVKAVTVLLTNGVDGVYAVVPTNGARNYKGGPEDRQFASFNTDGTIELIGNAKTLATSDDMSDYGCRGLTMTRYIPSDKPVLAFTDATVDEIKEHAFTGYSTGRSFTNGYTSVVMAGYNAKVTEASAGVATKLRVEMQADDMGYCKCVVVEFTNGDGGVYVRALAARSVTGSGLVGFKFVNEDGSYNGTERAFARDFSVNGYGVFALKAMAPTDIATAHWTGAAGDGDALNPDNWACTNKLGEVVVGGIPTSRTYIYLPQPMTTNLDWTALGTVRFGEGLIDLNGWRLAVASIAETPAEIETLITNAVEGAGDIFIATGTTKLFTNLVFRSGVAVTVGGGATLDENGVIDMPLGVRLEDGATLTNTGTTQGAGSAQFMGGLQVADGATAYIDTVKEFAFTGKGYATMPIDLGSGTLVKRGKGKISFQNAAIVGTGTIRLEEGEINLGNRGLSIADTVTLDLREHDTTDTYLWIQVTCEIPRITGDGRIAALSASLTVTKYFSGRLKLGQKGGGNQFKNGALTFGDTMTLDLAGVNGTWTQHKKMVYASNATVFADLAGRTVAEGDKIIDWGVMPPVTSRILAKGADVYFVRRDDGLYAARTQLIFVR